MLIAAITAVFFAGGIAMFLRGVFAPAPRLDQLADGSYRAAAQMRANAQGPMDLLRAQVLAFMPADSVIAGDLAPDLTLLGKTEQAHIIEKFTFGAVGAFFPIGGWMVLAAVGMDFGLSIPLVLSVPLAVVAFIFPDMAARDQANELRQEFLAAFAAYLDLCRILLGAADGPETALEKAAERGDGFAFQLIRRALLLAKGDATVKHWDALGQLGEEINVRELREFAAAMSMTATSQSQPKTLAARAASLRDQVLKDIAGDAEQATERMDIPLTMLTMAFTIFLMMAALNQQAGAGNSFDGDSDEITVTVLDADGRPVDVTPSGFGRDEGPPALTDVEPGQ